MPGVVTLRDVLPPSYGNVVVVAASSVGLATYLRLRVLHARAQYNIPPTVMFSGEINTFNCINLAYMNYMEHYPLFITTLLLGGIHFPRASALAGAVYLFGRYAYAQGYYTGVASKRVPGALVSSAALVVLSFCTFYFGISHSGLVDAVIQVGYTISGNGHNPVSG